MSPETCIDQYCEAWSDADQERRRVLLQGVWADGATYTDPTVDLIGADALLAHIASVHARRPGARVLRTSEIQLHHGVARFAWHVVMADDTSLPEGLDIAMLDDAGRISRIIGFFGPLRALR